MQWNLIPAETNKQFKFTAECYISLDVNNYKDVYVDIVKLIIILNINNSTKPIFYIDDFLS